ncbi:hypothetical protein EVAR_80754_1 [Eumeta japonica]|uniref:Uncharacterized protein n=1 Tax=Eumeta variegata TaxID=151549 RepID=A0A4C1XAX2_EUMVA|nr:hypothetical protein EVAR_80754_1 [Eumeta japonica]
MPESSEHPLATSGFIRSVSINSSTDKPRAPIYFVTVFSRGKQVFERPVNRWPLPPVYTRNPRGITSVLPASWKEIEYLMEGGVEWNYREESDLVEGKNLDESRNHTMLGPDCRSLTPPFHKPKMILPCSRCAGSDDAKRDNRNTHFVKIATVYLQFIKYGPLTDRQIERQWGLRNRVDALRPSSSGNERKHPVPIHLGELLTSRGGVWARLQFVARQTTVAAAAASKRAGAAGGVDIQEGYNFSKRLASSGRTSTEQSTNVTCCRCKQQFETYPLVAATQLVQYDARNFAGVKCVTKASY